MTVHDAEKILFPASVCASLAQSWHSRPKPRLAVIFGPQAVLGLYPWLLVPALIAGESILVADGSNSFNPYDVSKVAQWVGVPTEEILYRIHVSKAFSGAEMLTLVQNVPGFVHRKNSRLVLLSGLLDTFYNGSIQAQEATGLWNSTLHSVEVIASESLFLLTICPDHPMEQERSLKPSLYRAAEQVVELYSDSEGFPWLRWLKPGTHGPREFSLPWVLDEFWHGLRQ